MGASQHGCARRGCGDRSGGAGGVGGRGADPFIGDAHLAEAEVVAVSGELATVRIGPLTRKLPHHGLAPGPARVALRPETIELLPEQRADALAGEILKATYLGSHMEYTVRRRWANCSSSTPTSTARSLPARGRGPPPRPRPDARAGMSK